MFGGSRKKYAYTATKNNYERKRVRARSRRVKDRPYKVNGKYITDCAPKRGSHVYDRDGEDFFVATRGSRAQVMHGTSHHTCSGSKYVKDMFVVRKHKLKNGKSVSRIVSKTRSEGAKERWAAMPQEQKELMRQFQFRSGPKRRDGKGSSVRANPKFVDAYEKGSNIGKWTSDEKNEKNAKQAEVRKIARENTLARFPRPLPKIHPKGKSEADIFDEDSDFDDAPPPPRKKASKKSSKKSKKPASAPSARSTRSGTTSASSASSAPSGTRSGKKYGK